MHQPQKNIGSSLSNDYRYGYQGYEADDEIKGEGNSYTTEFRLYDPRVGKWLSVDPMYSKFPHQSPYVGMDNNPVLFRDPSGGETETDFYDKTTKKLLKHVDDGIDQSVLVDEAQFNESLSLAEKYKIDFNDQTSAKRFTTMYQTRATDDASVVFEIVGNLGTINNVLQGETLVKFNSDCEDAARTQCNNAGVQPAWRNDGVQMVVDNSIQPDDEQLTTDIPGATDIINRNLEAGNPVMVGISYSGGTEGTESNRNDLVGHFVVIQGRGNDAYGNYYTYWDNAYNYTNTQLNRFYVQTDGTLYNTVTSQGFVVVDVRDNINP